MEEGSTPPNASHREQHDLRGRGGRFWGATEHCSLKIAIFKLASPTRPQPPPPKCAPHSAGNPGGWQEEACHGSKPDRPTPPMEASQPSPANVPVCIFPALLMGLFVVHSPSMQLWTWLESHPLVVRGGQGVQGVHFFHLCIVCLKKAGSPIEVSFFISPAAPSPFVELSQGVLCNLPHTTVLRAEK